MTIQCDKGIHKEMSRHINLFASDQVDFIEEMLHELCLKESKVSTIDHLKVLLEVLTLFFP